MSSPTKTSHNDTYASIFPSNPALSTAGKRIVITGGGYGIGRELTLAYAESGAAEIAILGRKEAPLLETKALVEAKFPKTKVSHYLADVTDSAAVKNAAAAFGSWNVLLLNAGYLPDVANATKSDIDEWWRGYEINVKGVLITVQAFMPTKAADATVIGTSTAGVQFPKGNMLGNSAYASSKLALIGLMEFLAAEEPDLHVVTVHPGVIATQMFDKFDHPDMSTDTIQLSAHFSLWLASPEARFLRGKFVWCNWDVDELKAHAQEIAESNLFTSTIALKEF